MRVYLSGPMTGYPQFNIPAFDRVANDLRNRYSLDVISPAELDDPEVRAWCLANDTGEGLMPGGETWGEMIARDVRVIIDLCDAVFVLPGWQESKGALLEVFTAKLDHKPVYDYRLSTPMDWHRVTETVAAR